MEIRQINYFVRVAELGSISKAAVALNIAQSAVSRQIRKLEDALEVQLLHRNGRGVTLTHAGSLLFEHGRTAAELLDLATREINLLRSSPGGSAVVGVPPTVGRMFTIPFSRRFRENFPNANLRIVESFTGNLLEWLFAGRIDVAILYDDPTVRSAIFEPVVEEDLVCIGIPTRPPPLTNGAVTLDDLCRLPLVLSGQPHGLRRFMDDAAKNLNLRISVPLEVDALHSMLEAVRGGLGYTVLPIMAIKREAELSGLCAWPIIEPKLTRLLYVATAGQRSQAIPTQQLARLVRTQILDLTNEAEWRSVRRQLPSVEIQGERG
jgi:LysR family nitrogen assimilation transcriptional regulator